MTDPGNGWTSPSGDESGPEPSSGADWQAPSYPPSYPQHPQAAHPSAPPAAGGWQGWAPAWSPMPGVVPLRPLAVGELLDGGVKIIRRYPKPTLAASALLSTAVTLVNIAFLLLVADAITVTADTTPGESFRSGIGNSAASGPATLLGWIGGALLTGALVSVVSRAVLGQPATPRDAWDAVRPRAWALIGVALLTVLAYLVPLVLVVIVGVVTGGIGFVLVAPLIPLEVWLWTVLALAPAVLILERAGVGTALRRSRVLAMRSFWRVFGILALTWLITTVIASILVIPVALVSDFSILSGGSETIGRGFLIANAVAGGVATTLVAPYRAALQALLYVDQRMRTEGLDVALQAAAATPSTAAPVNPTA
jgi:hypothetical protein